MSKVVSGIYSSQTVGTLRSQWLPDSGTSKGQKKHKRKVDPAIERGRKKFLLKRKAGARLRRALARLRELEDKYAYLPSELPREDAELMEQLRSDIERFRDELRRIESGVFPPQDNKAPTPEEAQPQTEVSPDTAAPHQIATLAVPVPARRVSPAGIAYASREGQAEFRNLIIEAYGCCAVTGCLDESALEAAHIIPFVDARSHLITNGICLALICLDVVRPCVR